MVFKAMRLDESLRLLLGEGVYRLNLGIQRNKEKIANELGRNGQKENDVLKVKLRTCFKAEIAICCVKCYQKVQ